MLNDKIKPAPWEQYQALYLHTPFCRQKCLYCDFASYAGFGEEVMQAYTKAVIKEIEARTIEVQNMAEHASIYFGGGTPSVLPIECIAQLVAALKKQGFWCTPCEATIEVNPGTADSAKLYALRTLGFDRISFGVQSLNDEELKTIGRIHTAQQALEAIALAQRAGFKRISVDVIYGLPKQTLESLRKTLESLIATGIEHISVYGLIVEEGTPLAELVEKGKMQLPDEDTAADMYDLVQSFLKKQGFTRYEISNYAKNGQYSRHNTVYWRYHPYVAFGAAACGFDGAQRRTAMAGVADYIDKVQQLTCASWRTSDVYTIEELDNKMQLEEFMFMGLRRAEGADLAEARARFGVDVLERFAQELAPFMKQNMVQYDEKTQHLRLTERGMAIGNQIFDIFVII